jgi:ABC-2 type transport system ATP-binding protein
MKVGRTIVLSTHILEEAEELCDRVVVINHGQLIADASLADLVDSSGRLGTQFRKLTARDEEAPTVS